MGASVCHGAFAASDGFPVSPSMNETGIGAVVRKEDDDGVLRDAEIIEGLKHDADLFVEVGKHLGEILRIAFVAGAWCSIRFFFAFRRRLPREMRQVGRVVGEERLLFFRVALDEVEIDFEVHVRAVAVFDFIGNDTIVTHQIGLPKAGGFLTFLIEDAPSLVVIESEFADRVVSVLEGYVPFSHNLCCVAVLLELAWKARLGGFQENVLLVLTVKDNFQSVLEGIATGQQRPARGGAVGIGETAREKHALLC